LSEAVSAAALTANEERNIPRLPLSPVAGGVPSAGVWGFGVGVGSVVPVGAGVAAAPGVAEGSGVAVVPGVTEGSGVAVTPGVAVGVGTGVGVGTTAFGLIVNSPEVSPSV